MTEQFSNDEPNRTPEVDEVLRCIGRNLLLFQHIEHLLKLMMTGARLEGTTEQSIQAHFEDRRAKINKQTLGQLAGQFVSDLLADVGERDPPENPDEEWLSVGFSIQAGSAFVEQYTAEMKAVVDARNELIHHFLPRWSLASEDSTRAALVHLDEQHTRALPMRDHLQSLAKSRQAAAQALAALMATPEGARQFELQLLRHCRLIFLLGERATRTDRADGWTVLDKARSSIQEREPKELTDLFQRFGHRTLRKLLLASELFDIEEEPTPKGGTRTLYRINPRFKLQIQTGP